MRILSSSFVTTAVAPEGYPRDPIPEVAFAGRSNVGKSSMINALCQRRKLARVSKTPGLTRTLNFFHVRLEGDDGAQCLVRLCDLPGYGYAKVSKSERKTWQSMVETYLVTRACLRAVVSIVDATVGPTPDDAQLISFVRQHDRPVLVAATKIDKLPKSRRIPRIQEVARALGMPAARIVGVSSLKAINLDVLWKEVVAVCWPGRPLAP
jgi:GTP-binding protein